ncbi:MAG: hypothetical protein ACI4MS_04690 [Candidatus Coproplasma sp.]
MTIKTSTEIVNVPKKGMEIRMQGDIRDVCMVLKYLSRKFGNRRISEICDDELKETLRLASLMHGTIQQIKKAVSKR